MTEGLVDTAEAEGVETAAGRTGVGVAEGFETEEEIEVVAEGREAGWTTTDPAEGSPGMIGFDVGAA